MSSLNIYQQALLMQFTNLGIELRLGRDAMRKLLITIEAQEIYKEVSK